jgi:hypothetical protein
MVNSQEGAVSVATFHQNGIVVQFLEGIKEWPAIG